MFNYNPTIQAIQLISHPNRYEGEWDDDYVYLKSFKGKETVRVGRTLDSILLLRSGIKENLYREQEIAKLYNKLCANYNSGKKYPNIEIPDWVNYPPKPKQIPLINIGRLSPRVCLFCWMGIGKTYISSFLALKRIEQGKTDHVIVITTKSAISQWESELQKFFNFKKFGSPMDKCFTILNYEALLNKEKLKSLIDTKSNMIILDETTYVKNVYAARTKSLCLLLWRIKYRVIMTGTPVQREADDLYSQITFANPFAINMSHYMFLKEYFYRTKYVNVLKKSARATINRIVYLNSLIVPKEEAHQNLPPLHSKIEYVNPHPKQLEIYNSIKDKIVSIGGNTAKIKNQLLKSQQASSGFFIFDSGDIAYFKSAKINRVIEIASIYHKAKEQCIIWTWFRITSKIIMKELSKRGISSRIIDGSTSKKVRATLIEEFKKRKFSVLIAQIECVKHGLNLQFVNKCIFAELCWSPATISQCVSRIHREGVKEDCYCTYVCTTGLIDTHLYNVVSKRAKVTKMLLSKILIEKALPLPKKYTL